MIQCIVFNGVAVCLALVLLYMVFLGFKNSANVTGAAGLKWRVLH